jgi:hypothetical protein
MKWAAIILASLILAACGGNGGGWTEEQREDYIRQEMESNDVSRETAECYADYFEDRWPDYDELQAMNFEEDFEEIAQAASEAQAKCGEEER